MNTYKHTQELRTHLLDMAKLSQRAVDYGIKGYRLGSPEFCRHVRYGDRQLRELRRKIVDLCQKPPLPETTTDSNIRTSSLAVITPQARFPISALRICDALHAACLASSEIAHHTMLLLEEIRVPACNALDKVSHLVNRQMCMCIIALFKSDIHHAETVLRNQEVGRLLRQAYGVELLKARISLYNLGENVDNGTAIAAALELAIANSFSHIVKQIREIAEAIIFWLKGRKFPLNESAIPCL
jgi:phosphate uptake regulator